MKTFAYCDQRYERATREASGVTPFTSPPITAEDFVPICGDALRRASLVYFNLHAVPGNPFWLNTAGQMALDAAAVRTFDWTSKIVFMVNCYAGGGMLDVLKAMNPAAIVGGEGENLGGVASLAGADLLGLWFRRSVSIGMAPRRALQMAQTRLRVGIQTNSVKDALEFEVLYEGIV